MRLASIATLLGVCTLLTPTSAEAQCTRATTESFVAAAHRCVGWLQHPDQTTRVMQVTPTERRLVVAEDSSTRGEMFPGAAVIADQFLAAVADIAVDRARKQGLVIVHKRIVNGVCLFPAPMGLSTPLPLLPETCALIKATDLLSLIGQARSFRTALTKDITRIVSTEFSTRFANLPPVTAPATAAFSLIRRLADEPGFRPGEDDVRPIAEAFLNAPWATADGTKFDSIVPVTRAVATLEVAVSAARVYALAMQMRKEEERTYPDRDANARRDSQPVPAAPPSEAIDVVTVIDLQRRLCPRVFTNEPSVCPLANFDVLEWTNLGVRSVARLQGTMPNYRDALRAVMTLVFEATEGIQRARRDPADPTRPDPLMDRRLATVRWARTIALSSTDMDPARLISAMAEYIGDAVVGSCDDGCSDRRKTAAVLGGISAYSLTYVEVPADATDEQRRSFLQTQQTARNQALESVIDVATDRRHRAGEGVISLGTGVGASVRSIQRLARTSDQEIALQVPFGVAWQRLPSPGWRKGVPFHLMLTALDLGNYIAKDPTTRKSADWQAIFAPGVQVGLPLSTSPSHFFVIGASASYLPRFTSNQSDAVQSARNYGGFINFYVPLWDFN